MIEIICQDEDIDFFSWFPDVEQNYRRRTVGGNIEYSITDMYKVTFGEVEALLDAYKFSCVECDYEHGLKMKIWV